MLARLREQQLPANVEDDLFRHAGSQWDLFQILNTFDAATLV
jgi:hypothetical protein